MGLIEWVALGFGSGFAFGVVTNRIGLWTWMIRRWNEDVPESPASGFVPVPLKFRRLPPPREPRRGAGAFTYHLARN